MYAAPFGQQGAPLSGQPMATAPQPAALLALRPSTRSLQRTQPDTLTLASNAGSGASLGLSGSGVSTASDNGLPKQLIVNYLAPQVADQELNSVFAQFGPVELARIVTDKDTGRSKGFGFVYFEDGAHAAAAMAALSGMEMYGKNIKVSLAVPQRPSAPKQAGTVIIQAPPMPPAAVIPPGGITLAPGVFR